MGTEDEGANVEDLREVLAADDELVVALVIDEQGVAIELESSDEGPDLTVADEVVVVAGGQGCKLAVEGPNKARATIFDEPPASPEPTMVMVRVFEFFEGWELFVD